MKKTNPIAAAGIALLLGGCIPSVNPFYTPKDVIFDSRLLGEWQTKESSAKPEFWKFEKGDGKACLLTVTDKDRKAGQFKVHLFKLKQEIFLDLFPAQCNFAEDQADLVAFSMFPGHLLAHVSQIEPELKVALFDFDWLKDFLEQSPKSLAHHVEDKSVVLTASTRDLQRFVIKHFKQGKLFETPGTFSRKEE